MSDERNVTHETELTPFASPVGVKARCRLLSPDLQPGREVEGKGR